jgi:hypothetical protein
MDGADKVDRDIFVCLAAQTKCETRNKKGMKTTTEYCPINAQNDYMQRNALRQ